MEFKTETQKLIGDVILNNNLDKYKNKLKNFTPKDEIEENDFFYLKNLDFNSMTEDEFWKHYENVFITGAKNREDRAVNQINNSKRNDLISELRPLQNKGEIEIYVKLDKLEINKLEKLYEKHFGKYLNTNEMLKELEDEELLDEFIELKHLNEEEIKSLYKKTILKKFKYVFKVTECEVEVNRSKTNINDINDILNITKIRFNVFADNQINNYFLKFIAKLKNLEILELHRNKTIVDISFLKELTNLIELDLADCNIIDISPLKELTSLKSLSLNSNKIIDISPVKKLTNLVMLNISYNKVKNGFYALKSLTNLDTLYFNSNRLSYDDKEELERALPKCDFWIS